MRRVWWCQWDAAPAGKCAPLADAQSHQLQHSCWALEPAALPPSTCRHPTLHPHRQPSPETGAYGAALAGELLRRFASQPYVRSAFSSADFADLAEACAALFGSRHDAAAAAAQPCDSGSGAGGGDASSSGSGRGSDSAGAGAPPPAELPGGVAGLLDELAGEVRRQLANKSSRSPWAPRDLVRLAR